MSNAQTDWRALCEELADSIELLLEMRPANAKPLSITEERYARARALLAQPEPEVAGVTDEELWELWLRLDRELPDRPAAVAAFWEHAQVEARSRFGRRASGPTADQFVLETLERLRHASISYRMNVYGEEEIRMYEERAARTLALYKPRHRQPAPVPIGEVGESVAWLRETGDMIQPSHLAEHQRYKRATDPLEQRQAALVPAEEEESCLQWTENRPPGTDDCPYDHCIAETPFGRFLITWKSWKEHSSPTIDETPWGDWWQEFSNVDKAKDACKREYVKRLLTCRVDNSAADLLERQATACAICERERLHQSTRAADLEMERQAAPVPVAVSERPWEREGWCDAKGECWGNWLRTWKMCNPRILDPRGSVLLLPAHALPLPSGEVG